MTAYKKGFTLIELMIGLTILSVLIGVAVPELWWDGEHARRETQKNNLKEIREAVDKYFADKGRFPKKLNDIVDCSPPYLHELPIDPYTGSADWEVSDVGAKRVWYRTTAMNYPGAPPLWKPAAESAVYDIRPRRLP